MKKYVEQITMLLLRITPSPVSSFLPNPQKSTQEEQTNHSDHKRMLEENYDQSEELNFLPLSAPSIFCFKLLLGFPEHDEGFSAE